MSKTLSTLSRVQIKDVEATWDSQVAIVDIVADIQHDNNQVFTGSARRHPDDSPNADVAILLAQARAYTALANSLTRRAQGLVAHRDEIKRLKDERKVKNSLIETVRQLETAIEERQSAADTRTVVSA